MPHSPFTRYFVIAIVAAYFLALLWPVDHLYLWGWHMALVLPVIIGAFTWSTVRNTPPFDDLAFHRTLPPGDSFAFRRVLMIHGIVIVGIALAVVVYCWVMNFGWQVMSYGILALTLPVVGLMGATGVAASLSSSRYWGRSWGYMAIFVVPVFSAAVVYWQHNSLEPINNGHFYFGALRTMALSAAFLYPLVWWLVAAKRRRALGFGLGAAIGAMLPWIYIYGGFIEIPKETGSSQPIQSHVTISRKPVSPSKEEWIPASDVLSIVGLRQGEFIASSGFDVKSKRGWLDIQVQEIPNDQTPANTRQYFGYMIHAGKFDGENTQWGKDAIWNHLRKKLPPHEEFGSWHKGLDIPTHPAFRRPNEPANHDSSSGESDEKEKNHRGRLNAEDFASATWSQYRAGVYRMEKVGEIDAAVGGTCRLPGGGAGVIKVGPLQQKDSRFFISFRFYYQDFWQADGSWFKAADFYSGWSSGPWVTAVDESGKRAFTLFPQYFTGMQDATAMFCRTSEIIFDAGEAKTREDFARMEMLRRCHLHVFWPKLISKLPSEITPPH